MITRTARLEAMQSKGEVDVLIIGAGVNGAGLFRDLCEQGVDCLIIDKADFGSGTSAAPSRLIHGGLKYLETGEFRLVAQSTHSRLDVSMSGSGYGDNPKTSRITAMSVVACLRNQTAAIGFG